MLKAGFTKYLILTLMILFFMGNSSDAQIVRDTSGFRWRQLDVTDPTINAKIQFNPTIPTTATNISWNFGDGSSSTELNPTHTYSIVPKDSFNVVLSFRLVNDSTITRKVNANPAFFIVRQDSSLLNLATHKRVFASFYAYNVNSPMRFEWSLNNIVVENTNNYPKIYYTFQQGGVQRITLKVWNSADPTTIVSFTRTLNILPVFGAVKEKFPNIPNVFTPNGDNYHDYFEVPTSGTSRLKFMVYSRAGSLIYMQETNMIKWDGTNLYGKEIPEGIYYYIIEDLDGKYENAKGFFYIFRGK